MPTTSTECFRHSWVQIQCFAHIHLSKFRKSWKRTYVYVFLGLEQLPPSLLSFRTTLSLGTEAKELREMELAHLKNLITLDFSGNPWFIFNGVPSTKFTITNFSQLKRKLPSLATLFLKVGTNRGVVTAGEPKTYSTVKPGLIKKFKSNQMENREDGTHLRIECWLNLFR